VHSVEGRTGDEEFSPSRKRTARSIADSLRHPGYRYACPNTWQPTEAERRLADPQILAAMNDLQKIPKEKLPERVAKARGPNLAMRSETAQDMGRGDSRRHGDRCRQHRTCTGIGIREMEIMTQAGLTPLQILRSATPMERIPWAWSARSAPCPRKVADLVILDGDPLADVTKLEQDHRVIRTAGCSSRRADALDLQPPEAAGGPRARRFVSAARRSSTARTLRALATL